MKQTFIFGAAVSSLALLVACGDSEGGTDTTTGGGGATSTGGQGGTTGGEGGGAAGGEGGVGGDGGAGGLPMETGYVFTMSNADGPNDLIVFERADDGSLDEQRSVPTGGLGSGDGLGSQGALTLSPDGEFLYVVNPGSNQVSSFRVYDDHLALIDLVDSGGLRPISVTASDSRVYVLNGGGDGGVQGFSADGGVLSPIAGSTQPLSAAGGTGPAQLQLNPNGDAIVVTEKATSSLLTYWVAPDGSLSAPSVVASEGMTPFGFDFAPDGTLVVSEAFGGGDGLSAVSSYGLGSVSPAPISSSVPSGQTAACWLLVAQGKYAYTTNTGTGNISGYDLATDGSVALFDDGGVTALTGTDSKPIDLALNADHSFIYSINAASDRITSFAIQADGSLDDIESVEVPATAVGLAAR